MHATLNMNVPAHLTTVVSSRSSAGDEGTRLCEDEKIRFGWVRGEEE